MGKTFRCAKCKKGISKSEPVAEIDDNFYHKKCAERIERGKK